MQGELKEQTGHNFKKVRDKSDLPLVNINPPLFFYSVKPDCITITFLLQQSSCEKSTWPAPTLRSSHWLAGNHCAAIHCQTFLPVCKSTGCADRRLFADMFASSYLNAVYPAGCTSSKWKRDGNALCGLAEMTEIFFPFHFSFYKISPKSCKWRAAVCSPAHREQ